MCIALISFPCCFPESGSFSVSREASLIAAIHQLTEVVKSQVLVVQAIQPPIRNHLYPQPSHTSCRRIRSKRHQIFHLQLTEDPQPSGFLACLLACLLVCLLGYIHLIGTSQFHLNLETVPFHLGNLQDFPDRLIEYSVMTHWCRGFRGSGRRVGFNMFRINGAAVS